jgi:hypothetical protein
MTASPDTLAAGILGRVQAARRAVDRRGTAARPRLQRRRARPANPGAPSLEERRETESLKQVFHHLGILYRRYRRQTGGPVAPGLRAATDRFRAEPSLPNLIEVAAILEQLDLLS